MHDRFRLDDSRLSRYWSATRLAAYLGTTVHTINRWRRAGIIPHIVLPSGVFRYDPEQIEDVLLRRGMAAR